MHVKIAQIFGKQKQRIQHALKLKKILSICASKRQYLAFALLKGKYMARKNTWRRIKRLAFKQLVAQVILSRIQWAPLPVTDMEVSECGE